MLTERRQRGSPREYLRLIAAKKRPGARIRLAVSRCFIAGDGQPITVRQVLERAYPRLRRFNSWHYHGARLALRKVAITVARNRLGRERPSLWVPRKGTAQLRLFGGETGDDLREAPDSSEVAERPQGHKKATDAPTGPLHNHTGLQRPVRSWGYRPHTSRPGRSSWPVGASKAPHPLPDEAIFVRPVDDAFSVVGAESGTVISDGLPSAVEAKRFVDGFDEARDRFIRPKKRRRKAA